MKGKKHVFYQWIFQPVTAVKRSFLIKRTVDIDIRLLVVRLVDRVILYRSPFPMTEKVSPWIILSCVQIVSRNIRKKEISDVMRRPLRAIIVDRDFAL